MPKNGLITIQFPALYESLYSLNSECILGSALTASTPTPYCEIIDSHTVSVVPNGLLLSSTETYSLTLTNITNPNSQLADQEFVITSYFSEDVYRGLIIARNSFAAPEMSIMAVKEC